MSALFIPYDTYERHKKVGELLGEGKTVVDIGGQLNMLSRFSKHSKLIVANLDSSQEKSDVKIDKGKLPFENNSFDISCAIDVLEHVPQPKRRDFIKELLRISGEKTILSFPIGTNRHKEYELEIQSWLERKKQDVSYLKEHIKFGLPTEKEVRELTKGMNVKLFYSGNLLINKILFKLFLFDPNIPILRRIIYFLKSTIYFLTNPILYAMLARKKYSDSIVRAYLVIEK